MTSRQVVLLSTYDLGHQPFGLASPTAWLRERGHQVTAVDLSVSPLPREAVRAAHVVAIHLPMHTATRLAVPVLQRVRELNASARLIAFGLYAPLNDSFLKELGVEQRIGGEFEADLLAAVEGFPHSGLIPLDRLEFKTPDRSSLPRLSRYAQVQWRGQSRTVGYTEASRGCKHLCRHCPIVPVYGGVFRVVPSPIVLADIGQQVEAGAEHITFGDPDFFNGPSHAMRLVDELHREFPTISYDATIKVEHLLKHRQLLPRLADTGCLWITSAVESTQDGVLERLDKGHTRADFLELVDVMRVAGVALSPTFVPFTPWTTLAGYRDLLRVVREADLVDSVAPIQLALRLLVPAGSRLLELKELGAWLHPFVPADLLHRWSHPDPDVDTLAAKAFEVVAQGQRAGTSRRIVFAQLWELANGRPIENYDLMPRATVPYLNEPWYC